MKNLSVFAIAGLASSSLANVLDARATKSCNPGNNCQRGVAGTAGTKPPLSSRLADCSSFLKTTVTPDPT